MTEMEANSDLVTVRCLYCLDRTTDFISFCRLSTACKASNRSELPHAQAIVSPQRYVTLGVALLVSQNRTARPGSAQCSRSKGVHCGSDAFQVFYGIYAHLLFKAMLESISPYLPPDLMCAPGEMPDFILLGPHKTHVRHPSFFHALVYIP